MNQISAELEAVRRLIEERFAHAGMTLEQALEVVGALIGSLGRLASLIDGGAVEATTASLLQTADQLNDLPETHAERRSQLTQLEEFSSLLRRQVGEMRVTLKYLRVFALNVKVTAAGSSLSANLFDGFADDMSSRIDLGADELGHFDHQLEQLEGQLADALAFEQALAQQCERLLPDVPDRLARDASAMALYHRRVGDTAKAVAEVARSIQSKVARALSALQIGDITRQRIEHVQSGLEVVDRWTAEQADGEAADRLRRRVLQMLTDQLADAAEDFSRESAKMLGHLSAVATDAGEILRLQQQTLKSEGGLRGLEVSVGHAVSLVSDVQSAVSSAETVGTLATATVDHLAQRIDAIRSVKEDIHRMAMNTSLRCSRLGDTGKPLNVIAFELGTHANHLETYAGSAMQSLGRLRTVAADMATQREARQAQGLDQATGRLDGAVVRLRSAADLVDRDLAKLAAEGNGMAQTLTRTTVRLNLEEELGQGLRQATSVLGGLAGDSTTDVSDLAAPFGGVMAEIARLYTMARERTVHARHVGECAVDPEPSPDENVLF
jgi:hypothetical protein